MTRTLAKTALVDLLRRENTKYVFGIPGATEIHFMDALEQAPEITYILGLHEVVCTGMAEGYARATGKPAVLNLHTAPGLAAATPLLYNACMGHVPLVVTVGQNDTRLLQRDPQLTGDLVAIGSPYCKWATQVMAASDLPTVLRRAFKLAQQPPTGPVLVAIPQNILAEELDYHPATPTPIYARLRPDLAALDRAVAILSQAQKPLLLVESGIARSEAVEEIVKLAELTGARVQQGWMADVNFPVSHPQYLGDFDPTSAEGTRILKQTDVLVGVGCSLFSEAFTPVDLGALEKTTVIHIDDDPWELGKNLPTPCALQGDIKSILAELNEQLVLQLTAPQRAAAARRAAELAAEKMAIDRDFQKEAQAQHDHLPIAPSRLMREVAAAVGPNTILVDECWSSSPLLRQAVKLDRPGSFYRSRKGGSIGSGLPMALGVKLGRPDCQVLAVVGDGATAWSMQTWWTAAHYHIPVTYVITNNATYGQVRLVRKALLGDYPREEGHQGMELDQPVIDFRKLAESMGVRAQRVEAPADIGPALRNAMDASEPRVVEVIVEKLT